jgi:tripartite-type tricarboxylate transporter receptor subunit TctC
MKKMGSTSASLSLCVCIMMGFHGLAAAQSFPSKPIVIVVGSSPGSTTDGLARAIANEVTIVTRQPVIVENKPGASGGIAAQSVARATPDGYTVFMTTNTTQAANPFLYKKLSYDPVKDFAPVSALVKGYLVMVTNPNVKAKTVSEFISMARKEPGKLTFGSGSSSARVAGELFQQMTGVSLTHVPYKANPNAVTDLVSGQIDMMIVDLTTSMPQVRSGRLNALGVTSLQRSPLVPELPTLNETGLRSMPRQKRPMQSSRACMT